MKKAVILGCENSHANTFLNFIKEGNYPDIQIIGVYSDDTAAAEKLNKEFGVKVMQSYDEAVGIADGVIVTARHGDNHYKYAAPYIKSGVPMFIDKPVTVSEQEAVKFMRELKAEGAKITGGSCCKHADFIQKLKADHQSSKGGETLGGFVRAPISLENDYGNLYFYSQHLVDMVLEIYGSYPQSVKAFKNGKKITVVFRYKDFDVTGLFVDGNYIYAAARYFEKGIESGEADIGDSCFRTEFEEFYKLLNGGKQHQSYKDFIAPVFVINAIDRSLQSGNEEKVTEFDV